MGIHLLSGRSRPPAAGTGSPGCGLAGVGPQHLLFLARAQGPGTDSDCPPLCLDPQGPAGAAPFCSGTRALHRFSRCPQTQMGDSDLICTPASDLTDGL